MVRKVVFLFLAIALVAGLSAVTGCQESEKTAEQEGIAAIDLVPQTANMAISVDLDRIFDDDDVMDMINQIAASTEDPKTVDEMLDELEEESGIDLRDFSEVLVFGDNESEDYFGLIVTGDFDEAALINSIESAIGEELSSSDYRGYQLYSIPINDVPVYDTTTDLEIAICFLDSNTILGGDRTAVKDAIDVKEGASSLSRAIEDTYNALGSAWVKMAMEVPAGEMGEMAEEAPINLDVIQDIEAIGVSFNKSGVNLSFQLKLLFTNITSAADFIDFLDSMMDMLSFMTDLPSEATEIMDRLNVTQSGPWVTVSFAATKAEIEDWARDLESAFQDMEW